MNDDPITTQDLKDSRQSLKIKEQLYRDSTMSDINESKFTLDQQLQDQDQFKQAMLENLDDYESNLKFRHLKQLLDEVSNTEPTAQAKKYRQFYKKLSIPRLICFLCMVIISFFEKPVWCSDQIHTKNCTGFLNDERPVKIYIPTSGLPYIDRLYYFVIQSVLIIFLTFNKQLKLKYMKSHKSRKFRSFILIGITIFCLVDNTIEFFTEDLPVNLSLFYIPIYIVFYNGRLRRIFKSYIKIVIRGIPLLFALIFNIIMFAGIGKVIFENFDKVEDNYFNSFFDTCYRLTILQTTSNFPDVMMPYYEVSRLAPIYYISFLIINFILVMNMLLGVFYTYFKIEFSKKTKEFFTNYEKVQYSVSKLVQHDKEKKICKLKERRERHKNNLDNLDSLERSTVQVNQDSLIESNYESSSVNNNTMTSFNSANSEEIFDNQMLKLQEIETQGPFSVEFVCSLADTKFKSRKQKKERFQIKEDEYDESNRAKKFVGKIIFKSMIYEVFMALISIISFALLYTTTKEVNQGITPLGYVTLSINSIFFIEAFLRIFVLGWRKMLQNKFYAFEFVMSIFLELFMIIYFSSGKLSSVYEYFNLTKLTRYLRLMFKFESVRQIYGSLVNFFPYFMDLFGVLLIQFFLFAGLGMQLMGGQYNTGNLPEIEPSYVYNNFNDLAQGFILLFELLIVNNWQVNTEAACEVMGSHSYRAFFIVWYVFGVVLALNILIALIIDNLVSKWEEYEQTRKIERKNKMEKMKQKQQIKQQKQLQKQQQLRQQMQAIEEQEEEHKDQDHSDDDEQQPDSDIQYSPHKRHTSQIQYPDIE